MFKYLIQITLLVVLPFLSSSCDNDNPPQNTTPTSINTSNHSADIKALAKKLDQGIPKEEVEKRIGSPDYSPTDGLDYYSSDTSQTLILDYRDEKLDATNKLKSFKVEKIGE